MEVAFRKQVAIHLDEQDQVAEQVAFIEQVGIAMALDIGERKHGVGASLAERERVAFAEPVAFGVIERIAFGVHQPEHERLALAVAFTKHEPKQVGEPGRFRLGADESITERFQITEPFTVAIAKQDVAEAFAVGERFAFTKPLAESESFAFRLAPRIT